MRNLIRKFSSIRLPDPVIRILKSIVLLLAIGYTIIFLVVAILRLIYPYELEWIEGAYVDQAMRIAQGYFPYSPPNVFLIPISKTPVFFYLSAGLMKIFGFGFFAPRLLSILSTIGICILLLWAIRGESKSWVPGFVAAGIYIATFRLSGAWMDLAKTDSLFLFLLLLAFVIGQRARRWPGWMLSGLFFALAYFTKQLALPIILVLAVVSLVVRRGRNWIQWITAFVIGTVLYLGLEYASQGWFSFFTLSTGITHTRISDIWLFWKKILPLMWPAFILAAIYAWSVIRRTHLHKLELIPNEWENLALGGVLVITSWSIFLKVWTYDNGLMMASLGMALLSGLGLAELFRRVTYVAEGQTGNLGLAIGLLLAIIQFVYLAYNPVEQIPTRQDKAAADAFVHKIEQLPGEVLVFNHGFYSHLAGKQTYLHSAPLSDVLGAEISRANHESYRRRQLVIDMFNQSISSQYFDWIILDDPDTAWTPHYLLVEDITPGGESLLPVTGAPARPASLTVKNPVSRGGELPLADLTYNFLFPNGWSLPDEGDRWALEPRAELEIILERGEYTLSMIVEPKCEGQQLLVEKMNVEWNDQNLGDVNFHSCEPHSLHFNLPKKLIRKTANSLWFQFERAPAVQLTSDVNEEKVALVKFKSLAFLP
jgi:hypothetical protein